MEQDRATTSRGWREMRGPLARLIFPSRHATVVALGVASAVIPSVEHRWVLVSMIFGTLLPADMVFGHWTRRHGRFPVAMPVLDQGLAVVTTLLVPGIFPGVMIAILADNALTAVTLGRRAALRIGLAGVALQVAAVQFVDVRDAAILLAILAVETATCAVILGTLAEHEGQLRDRYGTLVDEVDVILWEVIPGTRQFSYVSPGAEALLGFPLERWYEDGFWADHVHPDDVDAARRAAGEASAGGDTHVLEYRMVAADGREVHFRDVGTIDRDASGRPLGLRGVMMDISDRPRAENLLREQATHDPLTGLPNRALFADRVDRAMRECARTGDPVAMLLLDLDDFKDVNDALGHEAGDRLLQAFARRLQDELRECDTVARLGGDEFAVVLTTDADEAGALAVAHRIVARLEQPFELDGMELQARSSIGIALHPRHAADAAELSARADVAMYVAKRSGRPIAVYEPALDGSSVRRLTLLGELRRAIDGRQLFLEHQPCVDLRTGRVTGFEALVRWDHPEHGRIPPSEFIRLAEVSGLIEPLSRWVIEQAVVDHVSAGLELDASVNLSARNLAEPDLVPWIAALLARTGFPASRLTVELTETEVLGDVASGSEALDRLRELGIAVSIDDFGTGHSALAYLKDLPVDELKIDRSFVTGIGRSPSGEAICATVVDLARRLGLRVVAEGVEDEDDLAALLRLGCERAQGFHLGRPGPASGMAVVARQLLVPA